MRAQFKSEPHNSLQVGEAHANKRFRKPPLRVIRCCLPEIEKKLSWYEVSRGHGNGIGLNGALWRHKRAYKLFELIVQGTKAREGEMLLFSVAASSCKLSIPLRTGHGAF